MQTIVIGGGISGLACAYRLRQMGLPVLLLEQSPRAGGVIESIEQDGFLFELGPQSLTSTETLLQLIESLGLSGELLRANSRAPRYVLVGGRLQQAPLTPSEILTTSLLSAGARWRLLTEPFRRSKPPEDDESVAGFVRRKFGSELLDRLAGPFVSGVYAGDPEKLSLRSAFPSVHQWEKQYGSVLRGAIKSRSSGGKPRASLCSFRSGVAALIRALAKELGDSMRCGVRVNSVASRKANPRAPFDVQVDDHGRTELLDAPAVIVATDAPSAGRLMTGLSARFPMYFEQVEYAPVAVVGAGYRREQVWHPLQGFGYLVARKEGLRVLGCVWNSSLFPGRAPQGMVNITSFAGGATDPGMCEWSEERIAETVDREIAGVLHIGGPPVTRIVRRHTRALPQYNLGHERIVAALHGACADWPGLHLAGNYLEGPSIGACVEQALRTAEAVQRHLRAAPEAGSARELERSSFHGVM